MRNATNEGQMGHIPADDEVCDDCGYNLAEEYEREQEQKEELLGTALIVPILWLIAAIVRDAVDAVVPLVRWTQSHRRPRAPEWDDRMFR